MNLNLHLSPGMGRNQVIRAARAGMGRDTPQAVRICTLEGSRLVCVGIQPLNTLAPSLLVTPSLTGNMIAPRGALAVVLRGSNNSNIFSPFLVPQPLTDPSDAVKSTTYLILGGEWQPEWKVAWEPTM